MALVLGLGIGPPFTPYTDGGGWGLAANQRWNLVGDSLAAETTIYTNDYTTSQLPTTVVGNMLMALNGLAFIGYRQNFAVGGSTLAAADAQIASAIATDPDGIFYSSGTNDFNEGQTLAYLTGKHSAHFASIRQNGRKLVIMTPPPRKLGTGTGTDLTPTLEQLRKDDVAWLVAFGAAHPEDTFVINMDEVPGWNQVEDQRDYVHLTILGGPKAGIWAANNFRRHFAAGAAVKDIAPANPQMFNPKFAGASAGVLPTGWTLGITNAGGVTADVQVDAQGEPYIALRGTPSGTNRLVDITLTTQQAAIAGPPNDVIIEPMLGWKLKTAAQGVSGFGAIFSINQDAPFVQSQGRVIAQADPLGVWPAQSYMIRGTGVKKPSGTPAAKSLILRVRFPNNGAGGAVVADVYPTFFQAAEEPA